MNTQTVVLWQLTFVFIALQIPFSDALCDAGFICVQTFTGQLYQSQYDGLQFPNVEHVFKNNNISFRDIKMLEIHKANIENIDPHKLGNLTGLRKLYINGCKNLKRLLPNTFQNNKWLHIISLTNNAIESLQAKTFHATFQNFNTVGELDLQGNKLSEFPKFSSFAPGLKTMHLDGNSIRELNYRSLRNIPQLNLLTIKRDNALKYIGDETFHDELSTLDVSGSTHLEHIDKNAFKRAVRLKVLRLDYTSISEVPSIGLDSLVELHLKGVTSITHVSDKVINLPKLKLVNVAEERRYLCCAFRHKRSEILHSSGGFKVNYTKDCRTRTTPITSPSKPASSTKANKATTNSPFTGTTTEDPWGGDGWGRKKRALLWFGEWLPSNETGTKAAKTSHPSLTDSNFGTHSVEHRTAIFSCDNNTNISFAGKPLEPVSCYPEPDALRPCDDIMGNEALTSISWIVSFIAVLSNGVVFSILLMSRRQFNVTKFLIINLAFADLCLGLYLFVLTCASIDTTGKYYNSVFHWQYEGGCDIVGFLAVFSSELSMLTLTLITIERYLAIVYAVYLQKRLSLRHARLLTIISWAVAILIALLPLAGVNSYKEVAICLPFKISATTDIAYLGFVFGFNSLLFVLIVGCYIKIYWAVAGPQSSGRPPAQANDSSIAKRIALLVFTDFACWLPIAIVGMIAAAGYSSSIDMTVEKSKYLLVIFFPINSICNPFLYALSTRTFRREFFTVLAQCGFCSERLHQYHTNTYTGHSSHRKIDQKGRRVTETINLSAIGPNNGNYVVRNCPSLQNGGSEKGKVESPTHFPLIIQKIGGPSTDNNNCSRDNGLGMDSPSKDINSQTPNSTVLEEQIRVDLPQSTRFTRFNSTLPLTENFETKADEEFDSVIETNIAC